MDFLVYCTKSIVFAAQQVVGCYTVAAQQVGLDTVGIADPVASTRADGLDKLALDCKR